MKLFFNSACIAVALATAALFTGCKGGAPEHLVIIGLDGWAGNSWELAGMPFTKSLAENGAYTIHKRSIMPTSSGANWATMFMGAGPESHGYTTWWSKKPDVPPMEVNSHRIFPNFFSLLREKHPDAEMGLFYQWIGMRSTSDTLAFNADCKFEITREGTEAMCDSVCTYIREKKPLLTFAAWDYPDKVGHTIGWLTPEYYQELEHLDSVVTRVFKAIEEAGIADKTALMIVSDHGGKDKKHGNGTPDEMEGVLILFGKGIKKTGEIKAPVRNFDVAPTLTRLMGLPTPEIWYGKPIEL